MEHTDLYNVMQSNEFSGIFSLFGPLYLGSVFVGHKKETRTYLPRFAVTFFPRVTGSGIMKDQRIRPSNRLNRAGCAGVFNVRVYRHNRGNGGWGRTLRQFWLQKMRFCFFLLAPRQTFRQCFAVSTIDFAAR